MKQKKVRILLRVSSNQQLEADGDLSVQRQLVTEYVAGHSDWVLDEKEYFEGSSSAYQNAVSERQILQEVYRDAKAGEYDILVVYKDDRLGRRMWEIGGYVMSLKGLGVDIYTVKDGCISPDNDDIMGQMVLALRYGNAQKASSDTGQRVKDTAGKLVQKGKFMGGLAPYGYALEYSGEISKQGRALKHLVIIPEQAEVVKQIYHLSLDQEYGSVRIAKILNSHETWKDLAPHDVWKSGTITSILTNPIYAGHTAYKRRERTNGKYRRLDSREWILSEEANEEIAIIDQDIWNRVQEKRKKRSDKYRKKSGNQEAAALRRNDGRLALIDVLYCGYCGCKMVNGSRYYYWTIKSTGERRKRQIPIYKCGMAWQGVPHDKTKQHRAAQIEPILWEILTQYAGELQKKEDVWEQIQSNRNVGKENLEKTIRREKQELDRIQQNIDRMEMHIPNAMSGEYPLSLEELVALMNRQKLQLSRQQARIRQREADLKMLSVSENAWQESGKQLPTWQEVFRNTDMATRRVLVNKLIERIDMRKDEITIRFQINLDDFFAQP